MHRVTLQRDAPVLPCHLEHMTQYTKLSMHGAARYHLQTFIAVLGDVYWTETGQWQGGDRVLQESIYEELLNHSASFLRKHLRAISFQKFS